MNKPIIEMKKKYIFYFEITVFIAFLYAISAHIYLNGDDFMYATFAKDGIFSNVAWYYLNRNGRFWINVLDSALLSFDRVLFIILNPIVIMAFIVLLAKNIQLITERTSDATKERRYIRYGMVMFACLDVMCLRETVFWITGMMNYLFPATVFLFATWSFMKMRANAQVKLFSKIGYFVLCMFASSSVEQFALMFVGFCTIILGADLIRREKLKSHLVIGYILSLISLAALIFAPGNFARVDEQRNASLFDDIWTLIHQNSTTEVAYPFMLMLTLCCCIIVYRKKRLKTAVWGFAAPLGLTAICASAALERAVVILSVLFVCIVLFAYCAFVFRKLLRVEIIALILVGIGSQVMLLISVVWGYRCMFSMYTVYMLLIGIGLTRLNKETRILIVLSGILTSIHPMLLFAVIAVALIRKIAPKFTHSLEYFCTVGATVAALLILFIGYQKNSVQLKKNIENTQNVRKNEKIHIFELENEEYSWYSIPMGEFHEEYYRRYYDLPDTAEIEYIENN